MNPFFIVGPTAVGKTEIAAEIARQLGAEIVSADAFQIYRGLDRLTAKPEKAILSSVAHHLLGTVPLTEEMNVEKFREAAVKAIQEIQSRKKQVIVVGGSGLYVKALTHGLSELPSPDPALRAQLNEKNLDELRVQLTGLDPVGARGIDLKNRRRVQRALEICLLTGKPLSEQKVGSRGWFQSGSAVTTRGVFVLRDRAELYQRIDRRVEKMFSEGVMDEVRAATNLGSTAEKALGFREVRALLAGEISRADCIARIQQGTRQYAKRQLTWFQRQHTFEPLNLSLHAYPEAIELIAQSAHLAFAQKND